MTGTAKGTRRHDSPVRRERPAETRERIITAGSEFVHDLSSWDWGGVTVRAVPGRSGVHERTVHRHFATERDLRAAVLQRLLEESGVTVEGLQLAEWASPRRSGPGLDRVAGDAPAETSEAARVHRFAAPDYESPSTDTGEVLSVSTPVFGPSTPYE